MAKKVKLKLTRGKYLGTDTNGNDRYSADYYSVSDVEKYIKYVNRKLKAAVQRGKELRVNLRYTK